MNRHIRTMHGLSEFENDTNGDDESQDSVSSEDVDTDNDSEANHSETDSNLSDNSGDEFGEGWNNTDSEEDSNDPWDVIVSQTFVSFSNSDKPCMQIESCFETVHVFSAVAQAKAEMTHIESIVLNVLDGSKYSNCDCCIYGYQKTTIHRENAFVKETFFHNSKKAYMVARQFQCSVKHTSFKVVNIQLAGKMESCNISYSVHPVLYPEIKENGFGICTKIAYNYINPVYLIEWFEYQKMMGVDMVLISLQSLNEAAYKVLRYYEREGIAKLISFPKEMPGKLAEINVLQDEVEKNYAVINDKFGSAVTNKRKTAVWGRISMMVSSLGVAHRSAKECKDKWGNTKKEAKKIFSVKKRDHGKRVVDHRLNQ
ncbi:unnamed protein product [Mytilus edulis]|uniref:Myb/SANT-like DNA-binding domain-containing protein n=1 Tax=Mytilus edulis TaxID=6550 RepID=A0A8S3QD03_MYTED|nr:unnamed protein product [Mytilus edulis]